MYDLKNVVMTPEVAKKAQDDPIFSHFAFKSFIAFLDDNWGEVNEEDKDANDKALESGERLVGSYTLLGKSVDDQVTKILIVGDAEDAEHKRVVTIMFPEEY